MNKIIPNIKTATALPGYKLKVEFEDGVDGVFELWNNEDNFKSFKITTDKKIEWSGDIDMDPDAFIYN